jgi:hypothetical protein
MKDREVKLLLKALRLQEKTILRQAKELDKLKRRVAKIERFSRN